MHEDIRLFMLLCHQNKYGLIRKDFDQNEACSLSALP